MSETIPQATASDIIAALAAKHGQSKLARRLGTAPHWIFVSELRLGTGYATTINGRKVLSEVQARMDAFAMHMYPSERMQRVAYEVKVNRDDFKREIRQPLKRRPALMLTNLFYFVAPDGVLTPDDIPQECGLLVVKPRLEGHEFHAVKEVVSAPWRDTGPAPWHFVAALGRRLAEDSEKETKVTQ